MFRNRADAGRALAAALEPYAKRHPIVLGVPRGGVVVAFEVARRLGAPLDVVLVRKLGVPYQPELGFGAIGEGGVQILDRSMIGRAGVSQEDVRAVTAREQVELERRIGAYRGDRPPVDIAGHTVIIVDDGIATGVSIRAAAQVVRARGAAWVVIAAPVAPPTSVTRLFEEADDVVVVEEPVHMMAIGAWYDDFRQVEDAEVTELLARSADEAHHHARPGSCRAAEVEIPIERHLFEGELHVPDGATGVVAFAHGSGSSRHSPRNRKVASMLNDTRIGTLLFDLLTPSEGTDRRLVFDIDLLTQRLSAAVRWLESNPDTAGLPIGLFGASTGAAAALATATAEPHLVRAVVSRGGRPDLVRPSRLALVHAPTLLIVGGDDPAVLEMNREAAAHLLCEHRIEVVPGAGHLFEEPGTLEAVGHLAAGWFSHRLTGTLSFSAR
jgi:putative phosphoribosyl transferase